MRKGKRHKPMLRQFVITIVQVGRREIDDVQLEMTKVLIFQNPGCSPNYPEASYTHDPLIYPELVPLHSPTAPRRLPNNSLIVNQFSALLLFL